MCDPSPSKKQEVRIKVENAVGTALAHDVTRIIPGEYKGVAFKKGHIIKESDIPELLKIGKRYLFVLELNDDELHEDDAALRIAPAISGGYLRWTTPCEGKSRIVATCDGLLKVNPSGLVKINKIGDIIVSTLKSGMACKINQTVAATRIIPLTTPKGKIEQIVRLSEAYKPILEVKPFTKKRVGAVITGSEICNGLIKDGFNDHVGIKTAAYGCETVKKIIVTDDPDRIAKAIKELENLGCDLIVTTGGLSVDPDDVTKEGVRRSGAKVISYGGPVLPGAMFLYGRLGAVPILGLPACVFYHRTTVYDLILPRVLAGEEITTDEIAEMGHGGLCMECDVCHFPACPFGR